MVSSLRVLPVGSSAEQPWGSNDERSSWYLSKAAKRRMRNRRTAVVKAQQASCRIMEVVEGGAAERCGESNVAASLQRLETKLDAVMQFLCCLPLNGGSVAETQVADYGTPVEVLQRQCTAARTVQQAWKRKQANQRATRKMISTPRGTRADADTQVGSVVARGRVEMVPEAVNPWLFLDRLEFGRLSATCHFNHDLVITCTPLREFTAQLHHQGRDIECRGQGHDGSLQADVSSDSMDASELRAEDMLDVIDMTAQQLTQHPQWQNVDDQKLAGIIEDLKSSFSHNAGAVYTRGEALDLMKLVGIRCAEAVVKKAGEM